MYQKRTVQETDTVRLQWNTSIGTTHALLKCYFEWPWVTMSDLAKYSVTSCIVRSLCESWASYLVNNNNNNNNNNNSNNSNNNSNNKYTVSQKTGPLRLIWRNFTSSQNSLIIFGTERPCSILHWYNFLNWWSYVILIVAVRFFKDNIAPCSSNSRAAAWHCDAGLWPLTFDLWLLVNSTSHDQRFHHVLQ